MADPLLSSLCRVCNTNPPMYRCPRCSSKTCSMACSKRHKLWSDCSGIRDPTIYKPRRELATPAGIDHDYNFISNIERGIERKDKMVIEERGLINRKELLGADDNHRRRQFRPGGDTPVSKALAASGTIVDRAPKGMKRNTDNGTNWSKHQKCINWQVEWVRDDDSHILGKALEKQPIREAYTNMLQEHRRANMTDAERKQDKKRKAEELKSRESKRARLSGGYDLLIQKPRLQNPKSTAWDRTTEQESTDADEAPINVAERIAQGQFDPHESWSGCWFYLYRPYTPSSHPKVLVPLNPSKNLHTLLQGRIILEFPTIYALSSPPSNLPAKFMLEDEYMEKQKPQRWNLAGRDEDTDMDEGEIF